MLEVGWTEMLVIAIVMIVVVGPKDLPGMLRTFGRFAAKARGMAGDFQRQFNDALKEAELDDVKKSVDALRDLNPAAQIRKQLNPFEQAAADVRAGVDSAMKPKPAEPPKVESADAAAQPAEPVKGGATAMPGVNGPDTMPPPVVFPAMSDASVTPPAATGAGSGKVVAKPAAGAKKSAAAKPSKAAASSARASVKTAPAVPAKAVAKAAPAKATSAKVAATKASPVKASPAKPIAAKKTPAKAVAAKKTPAKAVAAKAIPPKKTTRAK
ncbi:preprotein translocase subunit TatA [Mesorhizobium sp. Root554]|uniref:Sec-independent protein translocase protein TatB n=1 Tax=unclassified Mesorhizobium TaxID=325217 RepID=UPI0006FD7828|nr:MULTISPECIES: Sec-independent protein translocase protein TatB [unclassified Mesorhizobium]KQZ13792.1 preprotein translocase subunit TatA [Mesorhizobium sp. Root1471]KQZ36304.1 preprotein translocase subunit TatA [Mesorhizobium sp. Root554]